MRAWLFQIIAVVAVIVVAGYLIHNTTNNLASRGITSGFSFLERSAGFGIVQHLIDYSEGDSYARVFLVGLTNTLLVSALYILFASLLGFSLALLACLVTGYCVNFPLFMLRRSVISRRCCRSFSGTLQYCATCREPRQALNAFDLAFVSNRGLYIPWPEYAAGTVPFLLALLLAMAISSALFRYNKQRQLKTGRLRRTWPAAVAMLALFPLATIMLAGSPMHWDIPQLHGFNFRGGFALIPELAALTLALSIYTSTFIAEVIRSGIQSVPLGQHEAASSLGLPRAVTLHQVIIPQAMRVIIPPLTSQYLNIVKNSSLAAAIGYPDMVSLFAGTVLNQTGQAIETIAITMGVYLIISLSISLLMNIYNRKIALIER